MFKISLSAYFLMYVEGRLGLKVPDFHLDMCDFVEEFLDSDDSTAVLMIPRGHSKSTNLDIINGGIITNNPQIMIMHQGETDPNASKCSDGTLEVIKNHPLTEGKFEFEKRKGTPSKWWINASEDRRYGTFYAKGILSAVTGQRATFIQNDDVETPETTGTQEKREKLKKKLNNQVHIRVPGTKTLFIGTPHSHDSLYSSLIDKGARAFILKMFEHEHRLTDGQQEVSLQFNPVHCFSGIGKGAKYLYKDQDYSVAEKDGLFHVEVFEKYNIVDFYSRGIWEERFTPEEMALRRIDCNTINEWDSQYQMHDKPITESRLNPAFLRRYDDEPILRTSNGETRLYIGDNRIVSMSCHMDPSSGKKKRDVSSVALIFQDDVGRIYWHRSVPLTGAIINVDERGELIAGGQAWQVSDLIKEFHVTGMTVETNGVGTHVPANLLQVFKKRGLRCGVKDIHESKNKNDRILAGIEGPLTSGYLYAHKSILIDENGGESEIVKKMRLFNPETQDNPDDEIDALSKAITNEPIRIGTRNQNTPIANRSSWRPNNGMIDLQSDSSYT